MFHNRPDSLRLYLEIHPGDPAVRSRIHEVARDGSIFSASPKLSPQYSRIFRKDFLRPKDYEQHDMEWIEQRIKQRFAAFKSSDFPQIDEVIRGISF